MINVRPDVSIFTSISSMILAISDSPCIRDHQDWTKSNSFKASSLPIVSPVPISKAWRQQPALHAIPLRLALKCGSYATSGLRHSANMMIASLRATATFAFFLAMLPPLCAILLPKSRKLQSSPNDPIIYCAPCTSNRLNNLLPHFVIPSCLSTSPD